MKTFNVIFVVLFIIFAALQYNDPDPYIWIPIYLYAALLSYFAIQKRYNPSLYLAGFVIYLSYSVYLMVDKTGVLSWMFEHDSENIAQSMHAEKPWIEETREFFGLVIVLGVLLANTIWLYWRKNAISKKQNDEDSAIRSFRA
ncbi:MAG: hypothetical protein K0Q95_2139 [Bacteroidota bacterium]|jgi:hypothetical protein|nr:hypothetical protein [Bacteroidota bacterium]